MKHIEFDIEVQDDGFFVWLLKTFGTQKSRYWWRLPLGFMVRENYTGTSDEINMMKTVHAWKRT